MIVPGWHAIGGGVEDGLDIRESIARMVAVLSLPGVRSQTVTGPLSAQQAALLAALAERTARAPGILWRPGADREEWTAVDRANHSRMLRRLEQRGLVRRVRPCGRTIEVEVTPMGFEQAQRLTGAQDGSGGG